ncbi:hypothetical protein P3T76_008975 [Phytophthora citrophthora]|uniref:FYVE-type domain-containing protein n=1 Tax=Phytophthora citrophthora TaxID=4793 RepID=A0AAD9LJL4_9STRA|nr:hypothetical protein P3T76_008975 [Phytophthora citrophthora]
MVKVPPEHFNLSFQDSLRSTKGTFTDEIDVYRGMSMPSMSSSHQLDSEELLWSHTQAAAAPAVDFDRLSNMSLDQWDAGFGGRKFKHNSLQGFARRRVTPATTEVLVTGELQCTVAEAAKLLCSSGESGFNDVMTRIHGRSFLRGSVVHSFTRSENQEVASGSVKTAGFKHPTLALLDPDEQWCFLEEFHPSQDSFTLSQRSVNSGALPRALRPPIELVRRRNGFTRSKKRAHQLMGLSLGYSVEAMQEKSAVRLVFYGCASSIEGESSDIVERRLRRFARSVLKLPELLQHYKSLQEPQSMDQLTSKRSKSSNCVGCSRKFHKLMMIKKTRCYLCALFVCWKCWNRQPLNTINGRKVSVLVCPHCLDSIHTCNYTAPHDSGRVSSSSASTSSHGTAGELEDIFRGQVLPDSKDAPHPGSAVVSYLAEALNDDLDVELAKSTKSKPQAAANVLRELGSILDEGINRVMAHCSENALEALNLDFQVSSALLKLQVQFEREVLPMEACLLSNALPRSTDSNRSLSIPIPPNEEHRLEAIRTEQLLEADDSDELSLICTLATQELSCMTSLVSILDQKLQYVLASSSPEFQNTEHPREHTLCQYLLMGDKPLILQHIEADPRFCHLEPVINFGIKFYAGFPIFSPDGLSVVGSLCCLDVCPREVTQSQYSTLLHLTRTASSLMMPKSVKQRSLQQLQRKGS